MVNEDDFLKRLVYLMEYYALTPAAFADKINVQRSGISHLLSGRNKPSLDFILKIEAAYPSVNLYWLLKGSGTFLKENDVEIALLQKSNLSVSVAERPNIENEPTSEKKPIAPSLFSSDEKKIKKIVLFYTDGSFEDFIPTS